ncbi:MAG: GNAT family N-acetyltransferase [Proteobacteria bacterium]|nr:GNAT family N-acetyltransferase [Pseudomonadota bacterium]
MTSAVTFSIDVATRGQIEDHLRSCQDRFLPPLGRTVDISEYAGKIVSCARRFEAWNGGALVGLVAVYLNDHKGRLAYITSVSVGREWSGRGIAGRLLEQCVAGARAGGFQDLNLEVGRSNLAAFRLYTRHGFEVVSEAVDMLSMTMKLTEKRS